ncbi:MAG TPA: DUF1993 domain-containing protein, partial [Acidiferrobacteraceae bacterium]|nr:DUF1993 domain-containing protein [Acidiferrobacteraceae bacterium]
MALSMYQASVPVFVRMLTQLSSILEKGEAYAVAKKIDPAVLIQGRLAPDMFPLSRQIQIACDTAKGCGARLAGVEIPAYPDTETSFAELRARIQKTLDYLKTFSAAQIDGSEERPVTLKIRGNMMTLSGQTYLLQHALPNLFFHVTTAYAILRRDGVELGKP